MIEHQRPGVFALAEQDLLSHIAGEEAIDLLVRYLRDHVLEIGFVGWSEARVGAYGLHLAVLYGENLERGGRAGIAAKGIEEGIVPGLEDRVPVAGKVACEERSAIELTELDRLPARTILAR